MKRSSFLWALFGLLLFAGYLYTSNPSLSSYRDSGDLAAGAHTLGISHPPGYPLYALSGHLFLKILPLGNPAYALNLLSMLYALASLYFLARFFKDSPPAAFAAALFLYTSPSFWALSQVSEMYTLNALFAVLLLNFFNHLYFSSFLLGLGLGNHQTLILIAPALAYAFWRNRKEKGAALFFLLGLSVYLYLPLRAFADPSLNWGDPTSFRNFFRLITRADYGGLRLHPGHGPGFFTLNSLRSGTWLAFKAFEVQAGWAGILASLWGIWVYRKETWMRFSILAFILSGPFFVVLSNLPSGSPESLPILEPHLVLPMIFLSLWVGAAVKALAASQQPSEAALPDRSRVPLAASPRLNFAVLWIFLLLFFSGRIYVHAKNNRMNFSSYDFGKNLLASMEPDSILVDPDDATAFSLSYFQLGHGLRPDAVPVLYFRTFWGYHWLKRHYPSQIPQREFSSAQEFLSGILEHNLAQGRPVYYDLPQKVPSPYATIPMGFANRLYKPAELTPEKKQEAWARSKAIFELARFRQKAPGDDFFTRQVISYGASDLNNLGIQLLQEGRVKESLYFFRKSLTVDPALAEGWSNLGNAYFRLKEYPKSVACYELALQRKKSPYVHYNIGRAYWAMDKTKEAARAYLSAIEMGNIPEAKNDLGLIYLNTGQIQKAISLWREAARENPDYGPVWFNLGLGYYRLGEFPQALECFRLYQRLVPSDSKEAQDWIEKINRTR